MGHYKECGKCSRTNISGVLREATGGIPTPVLEGLRESPLEGTSELRPAAGRGIREVKNPMCKGLCCRVRSPNCKLSAGSEVEGGNERTCKTHETGKDGSHEMCLAL